ncbi:MAG: hypothetical protein K8J08_18710, partial [Thermoanaerobaculia bacterium]|nr:hypothetical protein [Thermoanaerobaculia bacterium]
MKGFWALLLVGMALAPSWSAAQIVGDANGDGLFDDQDVSFVATLMRHGSQRPYPMADVAAPCNGIPDPADGLWLQGAQILLRQGRGPVSRCLGETVGSPLPPPPEPVPWVTLDDLFLAVADQVPEFGGLYIEGDQLHLVLTDPSATVLHHAILAVEEVFGSDRFEGLEPVATQGDFGFNELQQWKEAATPLLTSRQVVTLDANERSNRITLGIEDPGQEAQILAHADDLGIPRRAIQMRPGQLTIPHADQLIPNLQSKQRPLVGSLGIGLTDAGTSLCTLGFLAKWYGIARGFVTNAHCLAPIGQEQFVD